METIYLVKITFKDKTTCEFKGKIESIVFDKNKIKELVWRNAKIKAGTTSKRLRYLDVASVKFIHETPLSKDELESDTWTVSQ